MYLYYCMLPHVWRICYLASITYSPHGRTYYRSGSPRLHPVHLYMVWFTLSNVDDVEIFFFIIPYWSIIVDLNNWVRPMFISFSVFWISSWRLGSCHLVCIWRILVGSPLCCFWSVSFELLVLYVVPVYLVLGW